MTRRGFLASLGAALAGATLDPEKLLWVPGARLISIPRARVDPWAHVRFARIGFAGAPIDARLYTLDEVKRELAIVPRLGDDLIIRMPEPFRCGPRVAALNQYADQHGGRDLSAASAAAAGADAGMTLGRWFVALCILPAFWYLADAEQSSCGRGMA